jgi:membrane associated rhomboid family serine protease
MFEEFKNAFHRPNNAHVQLIMINVVIYLFLVVAFVTTTVAKSELVFNYIHDVFAIPPLVADFIKRPWTLITYAFAHDWTGILPILFNMLALYWFGKLFIEYLGNDKLIAIYVLGALAGGILYLLIFNSIPYFHERSDFPGMVGASAAVYAVMVATATLLPDYTFFLLFFGPVRIKYIVLVFILISYIGSVGYNAGGNIAHLGGALIGFIYTRQLQVGINWGGWITVVVDFIKSIFSPKPKVKVTYRSAETSKKSKSTEKASQAEIDAILDKISDRGYDSLTKEEKEKLFNASKQN